MTQSVNFIFVLIPSVLDSDVLHCCSYLVDTTMIVELRAKNKKVVANRYFFVNGGVLKKIEGLEKLKGKTWLEKFEIWREIGSKLPHLSSHGNRTGVFVVSGKTRQLVQSRVDWIYKNIKFLTE